MTLVRCLVAFLGGCPLEFISVRREYEVNGEAPREQSCFQCNMFDHSNNAYISYIITYVDDLSAQHLSVGMTKVTFESGEHFLLC